MQAFFGLIFSPFCGHPYPSKKQRLARLAKWGNAGWTRGLVSWHVSKRTEPDSGGQLALVVAGVMAYAFLAPGNPLWAVRPAQSVAVETPATSGLEPQSFIGGCGTASRALPQSFASSTMGVRSTSPESPADRPPARLPSAQTARRR